MAQGGSARDHLVDIVAGELGKFVARTGLAAHQQAEDEGTFLFEEEDVVRLLVVHVAPDHPERRLVMTGRAVVAGASAGARFLHETRDVLVEERQCLLGLCADRFRPRATARAGQDEPLDDEPVGCLEKEDVLHPALVEERSDRAEDLLEVLARAALVDPHAVRPPGGFETRFSSPGECNERLPRRQDDERSAQGAARRTARLPANPASLTMSAVLARIDAPSVRTAMRARSHGVSSGPATPACVASTIARSTAARETSPGRASAS